MGWRGTLRSIAAAQRAAQRASARRHREYVRVSKFEAKIEAIRQAAQEVDRFENLVQCLTSVHRDCSPHCDWTAYIYASEPVPPTPTSEREATARKRLDEYQPTWLDKLFRRTEAKRHRLTAAVAAGQAADRETNSKAAQDFSGRHGEWAEMRDLARRVLALDPAALRDALDELAPLAELTELGSHVSFAFSTPGVVTAILAVNPDSVIPAETKSLLQTGKLSVKKMPVGRFYEIYQDYVAGAAFRIARELFALLPVRTVYVTAVANMLDTASGHMRDQAILSVQVPRATLEALRFDALDPSDALRNFNHRMDFKKTKGFSAIQALVP